MDPAPSSSSTRFTFSLVRVGGWAQRHALHLQQRSADGPSVARRSCQYVGRMGRMAAVSSHHFFAFGMGRVIG